jgi:decaprenyl-phosphate phosphoribosyltransferase
MSISVRSAPAPLALPALVRAMRPRQWSKNVLVAAAPGAGGVLGQGPVLVDVGLAFLALCLVSSATYLLNDVRDAEADRAHPSKRFRPVAAGLVSPRAALTAALALMIGGFAAAAAVNWGLVAVVLGYVALTVSYTLWLKHIAVIDIVAVASGFMIRAVAGGAATSVALSRWFVIVAAFGSLFIVAGKRHSEHIDLNGNGAGSRPVLEMYSSRYLQYVWTMASGVMLTAYCLWAFEQAEKVSSFSGYELSIIPFVAWVLRYALLVESGEGGTPEDIVLGDRTLLILSAVWVVIFGLSVYLS